MRVEVVDNAAALAARAAAHIATAARRDVAERGHFTLALSGGRTPTAMLEALTTGHLPWQQVHVFQVDERVAPDGHPDRNLELLRCHLLLRVPLPDDQVHIMPVAEEDLDAAEVRYAGVLAAVCGRPPVLDLVHLGLGADGHTASLLPGDPVTAVNDRDVATTGIHEGRRRMTLTVPALNRARRLLWLVTGADKTEALRRLLAGDRGTPAGRLRRDRALLLTDHPAAAADPTLL